MGLDGRLEELGRKLGAREAAHSAALASAREKAEELHRIVERALDGFHAAAVAAGAAHLEVFLGAPRTDDKHIRSVEFDMRRGRYAAIVTVKSRGEVTLVGPFRAGKDEGPCRTFAFDATAEIEGALGDLLEGFLEEAATP